MASEMISTRPTLTRRAALLGSSATMAALGLSQRAQPVRAENVDYADHPLTGTWMAMANPPRPEDPQFPAPSLFAADGTVLLVFPSSQIGPQGPFLNAPVMGTWEPDSDRRGHFTAVQLMSAPDGAFLGSVTIDGFPEVSEDGATFIDDGSRATITFRDAAGSIVNQIVPNGQPAGPPVTAVRMGVGAPGFPESGDATPAASPIPAEGAMATLNGVELYYEVHGDETGSPVFLLHGGLGNTEEFDLLVPDLVAAGYRTVAMDCRARGRSAYGDKPITYELMAADALALLDYLEIEQTDFVGWSDGAIIGLYLGFTAPQHLHRAVIYGANFTPDGFHEPTPSDQMPPFEKFVADYQRLSPRPERFEELLAELDALYKVAPDFSDDALQSIPVPVLILDGAEEEMIEPDQPVRMAELIPGAELNIMPDTGHFAPIAKPDEFNRIVLDFLNA